MAAAEATRYLEAVPLKYTDVKVIAQALINFVAAGLVQVESAFYNIALSTILLLFYKKNFEIILANHHSNNNNNNNNVGSSKKGSISSNDIIRLLIEQKSTES